MNALLAKESIFSNDGTNRGSEIVLYNLNYTRKAKRTDRNRKGTGKKKEAKQLLSVKRNRQREGGSQPRLVEFIPWPKQTWEEGKLDIYIAPSRLFLFTVVLCVCLLCLVLEDTGFPPSFCVFEVSRQTCSTISFCRAFPLIRFANGNLFIVHFFSPLFFWFDVFNPASIDSHFSYIFCIVTFRLFVLSVCHSVLLTNSCASMSFVCLIFKLKYLEI